MGANPLELLGQHFLSLQTERYYPHPQTIFPPGMALLRDEFGEELVEAPSDRKGGEKWTEALPHGGRPPVLQSRSLPLKEITRDFPGRIDMEILLTSHLKG